MKILLLLCLFLVSCASGPAITRRTTTKTSKDPTVANVVTKTTHVTTGYALAGVVEGVVVDMVTAEGDQIRGTIAKIDGGTSWIGRLIEWWGLNKVTGTMMPATLKGTEDVTATTLGAQEVQKNKDTLNAANKAAEIALKKPPL